MKKILVLGTKLIFIDMLPSESDEMFYDRINFILKNYLNKDLEMIINYSKIYANIKYKKCVYDTNTMEQILSFNH
jgi:hypothetical protein